MKTTQKTIKGKTTYIVEMTGMELIRLKLCLNLGSSHKALRTRAETMYNRLAKEKFNDIR